MLINIYVYLTNCLASKKYAVHFKFHIYYDLFRGEITNISQNTLMLPSADPVIKQSSVGSTARALTGESWAWKLCRWRLWVSSRTLIQPFRPPVISSCCLGATARAVAPDSWQQKAEEREKQGRGYRLITEKGTETWKTDRWAEKHWKWCLWLTQTFSE